jgi:hypothetical protein
MLDECPVFRLDRPQTSNEDLSKGWSNVSVSMPQITTACPDLPPQLEVLSIITTFTHSTHRICIAAVYRRPQPPATFLSLMDDYLQPSSNCAHHHCW